MQRRFAGLDGLRGYGMLLVLVAHVGIYGGLDDGGLDGVTSKVVLRGGYAVVMFFVLSGFLITGALLDTKDRSRYFRNFYARRALRILPIYVAVVVVGLVVVPAVVTVSDSYRDQAGEQVWYWLYATNIGIAVKG
jgi:peptidoglycan/LPS O-acetylase OafA/YrhL